MEECRLHTLSSFALLLDFKTAVSAGSSLISHSYRNLLVNPVCWPPFWNVLWLPYYTDRWKTTSTNANPFRRYGGLQLSLWPLPVMTIFKIISLYPCTGSYEIKETVSLTLLIIFLTFNLLAVEVLTSKFDAVTSSSGQKLCAVAKPSDVVLNVRSVILCGAICLGDELCVAYNYKNVLEECDLFDCSVPQNYSAVSECSSYKLQGKLVFIEYNAMLRGV